MAAKVQFSLRMIFVVTAVVALLAAEAVAFSEDIAQLAGIAIMLLLPPTFVAQILYARGTGRAFGAGALVTWLSVTVFIHSLGGLRVVDGEGIGFAIAWCLILAGGGVAVMVRWLNRA